MEAQSDFFSQNDSSSPADNKNLMIGLVSLVALILFLGVLFYFGFKFFGGGELRAATQAEEFINTQFLAGQAEKATVKVVGKVSGLYKLEVDFQGNKIDSYMTRDGKMFFPEAYEMLIGEGKVAGVQESANQTPVVDLPKNDKPVVEVFVMTYCPFGIQMQKGIVPVAEALGNKIDFQLKFVDYAMKGEIELQENLRQHCIAKEQNNKLLPYLNCFLKTGKFSDCLKTVGVDEKKLTTCYNATDKQFKVFENYNNKVDWRGNFPGFGVNGADNTKYGVQGSPTLVINGVQASTARDSASLLRTICSVFNNPPAECQKQLSTVTPGTSFGEQAGTDSQASCN